MADLPTPGLMFQQFKMVSFSNRSRYFGISKNPSYSGNAVNVWYEVLENNNVISLDMI